MRNTIACSEVIYKTANVYTNLFIYLIWNSQWKKIYNYVYRTTNSSTYRTTTRTSPTYTSAAYRTTRQTYRTTIVLYTGLSVLYTGRPVLQAGLPVLHTGMPALLERRVVFYIQGSLPVVTGRDPCIPCFLPFLQRITEGDPILTFNIHLS